MRIRFVFAKASVIMALAALPVVGGCGSSKQAASPATTASTQASTTTVVTTTAPGTTTPPGAGALQAEANAAATGDIPDNQVFLTFRASGYSLKYPEGWAQSGSGARLSFRDKNNAVRVVVTRSARPTTALVRQQVAALPGAQVSAAPTTMAIGGAPAIHIAYETKSAPNPVTGKRVTLGVERYYLWKGGRLAIVDLGSPVAPVKVDNVDAYRLIIHSFKWR